jgi:tRNA A-37 threonylcarbamoyl transferase component Bud32
MANSAMILAVGGPVQAKYGTYLPRPADEQLFNVCQAGQFAYVLACRQIGKSSLMFETSEKLSQAGVRTALIDLNSIGQSVEADSWYFSLMDELARKLKLQVDVQEWWESRPRLSTLTQRFLQFLHEVILAEIAEAIVIFVDEIDMTLGLGFTDDFFAAIRSIHNDRAQYPAYHRLTFVLLGVATPDELIKDHTRTPFNIGQAISLRDFTKEECDPFCLEIEAEYPDQGRLYFDRVYEWTSGHPYLTQKLCDALLRADGQEAARENASLVDWLVRNLFLAAEARGEDNIQFVQTRVTSDPHAPDMLRIYKRILTDENPVFDDEQSPPINRLKLYGLVVARNGKLEIRNKLYEQAFDLNWINEMLGSVKLGVPGRYKILQEIGQGGFSTVYLAQLHDYNHLHSVALKVLKSGGNTDTTQVKRFKQEARAVAKLEHPNIIRIFETSSEEEPSFIAMEYIPGGTLRQRLKSGPLARNEAMDIVRQIGAALAYAHGEGIIHRDVNPNNILLDTAYDPLRPRPVLTDFGLVKLLSPDDFSHIDSTSIIGTIDYMAPEQWRQETPTAATDQYALAITFFEMLTNQRPFESQSGYYKLMNQHLEEPLPPLSGVIPEIGSFFDDLLRQAAAKNPADRFGSMAEFVTALETANAQAEEVERVAQQNQAAKMVEAARGYIHKGRYNSDRALAMIEAALEMYPGYLEALILRGRIQAQQGQLEKALDDFRQAYEQNNDPSSEVGREYLDLLDRASETFWQRQQTHEAIKYYGIICQILTGELDPAEVNQPIWVKARSRLIDYHHHGGVLAYASGHPEQIDEAIVTLLEKIQELHALKAEHEINDLQAKLKRLQITKYENMVQSAQAALEEINGKDSQVRFNSETIFQHYFALDEAYQALIELEPENEQWVEKRHKKLRERAESRCVFAARALAKLEPDYEAALWHYKAILEIEQTKYPGLSRELHLNLSEKIAELQVKANYDGKYNEIRKLMDSGEYQKALDHLDHEFIRTGNYEHRDTARWLWGLVYIKRHEGRLPPEWDSLSGFETLSKRLITLERGRIQQLKDKLGPWSQARIFETFDQENELLAGFEEQVKNIEVLISEAVAHGVTTTPEIEGCRQELAAISAHLQGQHRVVLRTEVSDTVQNIEAWLQRIEDIEALLQTGDPIKDIPEFFNRIDEIQQMIEADSTLARLCALVSTNIEIGQTINQLKDRLREQLVRILIEDVGQRDEALVAAHKELTEAKTTLAQVQGESAKAQAELAGLRPQVTSLKREQKGRNQEHEINRFIIPVTLVIAVLAGGVIAPRLQAWSGATVMMWVALVLLVIYFVYYIWVYYISQSRR